MNSRACIELKDLKLPTSIGSYTVGDTIPDHHMLDITLWIDSSLLLIAVDGMEYVFDYDPLIIEIHRVAADGHYETQERLVTRIVGICTKYSQIKELDISLRKSPVKNQSGSLGVRLQLDHEDLEKIRNN